jgi:hypothetical protein
MVVAKREIGFAPLPKGPKLAFSVAFYLWLNALFHDWLEIGAKLQHRPASLVPLSFT